MIDKIWTWFASHGLVGSVSVKKPDAENGFSPSLFTTKSNVPDDHSDIHQAIYDMDPDYSFVIVASNAEAPQNTLEVSFVGSQAEIQQRLDDAILEGLGHQKCLKIKETGAVVRFGYSVEDLP